MKAVDVDTEFFRKATLPEELKVGRERTIDRRCGYRWFAAANVVKFEDHQPQGEASRSIVRLRERRREACDQAIEMIMQGGRR